MLTITPRPAHDDGPSTDDIRRLRQEAFDAKDTALRVLCDLVLDGRDAEPELTESVIAAIRHCQALTPAQARAEIRRRYLW